MSQKTRKTEVRRELEALWATVYGEEPCPQGSAQALGLLHFAVSKMKEDNELALPIVGAVRRIAEEHISELEERMAERAEQRGGLP